MMRIAPYLSSLSLRNLSQSPCEKNLRLTPSEGKYTKYLTNIFQNCQGINNKEILTNYHSQEGSKEIQPNAMRYPEWDSETEKTLGKN